MCRGHNVVFKGRKFKFSQFRFGFDTRGILGYSELKDGFLGVSYIINRGTMLYVLKNKDFTIKEKHMFKVATHYEGNILHIDSVVRCEKIE